MKCILLTFKNVLIWQSPPNCWPIYTSRASRFNWARISADRLSESCEEGDPTTGWTRPNISWLAHRACTEKRGPKNINLVPQVARIMMMISSGPGLWFRVIPVSCVGSLINMAPWLARQDCTVALLYLIEINSATPTVAIKIQFNTRIRLS